ncbi:hypothetical protein H0H92_010731 [Tricholoma furcatifolium]|nr:hypothetical protein H0H92_010731 [Tricholoma furcatifolium]
MDEPTGWFQKQSAFEIISHLDNENYRVAWTNLMLPKFLLECDRWQMLTVLDDGKTKYETIEAFKGPVAYIIKWVMYEKLVWGFNAQAVCDPGKKIVDASRAFFSSRFVMNQVTNSYTDLVAPRSRRTGIADGQNPQFPEIPSESIL